MYPLDCPEENLSGRNRVLAFQMHNFNTCMSQRML